MEQLILSLAVRWWALIIGVVIHFIVGMLWYGPFFGTTWVKLVGLTEQQIREGGKSAYVGSFITSLITTYILAVFLNLINSQSVTSAIIVVLLVWLGFSAAPALNHNLFEGRPGKLFAINSLYDLITLTITAVVLQLVR